MTLTPAQLATRLQRDTTALKRQIMTRVVATVRSASSDEAPIRTGELRRSFTTRVESTGDRGVIGNTAPHAPYVYYGTKPHIITPANAKVLRFMIGNRAVFAKRVRHPGTKPNRFFDRALTVSRDTINQIMQQEANLWLRSLVQ